MCIYIALFLTHVVGLQGVLYPLKLSSVVPPKAFQSLRVSLHSVDVIRTPGEGYSDTTPFSDLPVEVGKVVRNEAFCTERR